MSEPAGSIAEIRALTGEAEGLVVAGSILPLAAEPRGGLRCSVRIPGSAARFSEGTLVELDTPECLYLGAVRGNPAGDAITVEVEHELSKAMLGAVRKTWGTEERSED